MAKNSRKLKTASTVPLAAQRFAELAGVTFGGKRDVYRALGYKKVLQPGDYRARFQRNEVAARVITAYPEATWRGGGEVWEDQDPDTLTPFEEAYDALNKKFKLWPLFRRADALSRLGQYAIIVIGAPGELNTPLTSCTFDEIAYMQPYAQEDAPIQRFVADRKDPRYGLPLFYTITRNLVATSGGGVTSGPRANGQALPVHYSRVLHLSEGRLDDDVLGTPALRAIWNRLDDLEKVAGGGAEAFWKRADQGMQIDVDPMLKLKQDEIDALKNEVDAYINGLKRVMRTRGLKVNMLGSDVANFDPQVKSIIGLISAGTGIPQRILIGSEQAKLASEQDSDHWDERIATRREEYAEPYVVRPFVDWMIHLGVLPEVEDYEIKWELAKKANVAEQAEIAKAMAAVNQAAGETIFSPDEIRAVMGYGSREDAGIEVNDATAAAPAPKAASRKGAAAYAHVHRAADRFRPTAAQRG